MVVDDVVRDAIEVVRDAGREEGAAIVVERIALYREGRCLSDEPRARFAMKTLPKECEALQDALATAGNFALNRTLTWRPRTGIVTL